MNEVVKRENIEKVVCFISEKFRHAQDLTKPVLCHSLRTGFYLYDGGYSTEIVLAGFLHDTIEDTDTSLKEIEDNFGKTVASLVEANSKDLKNNEKTSDMISRCVAFGEDALIIKAADAIENIDYSLKQKWPKGLERMPIIAETILSKKPDSFTDQIFEDLKAKYLQIKNR